MDFSILAFYIIGKVLDPGREQLRCFDRPWPSDSKTGLVDWNLYVAEPPP